MRFVRQRQCCCVAGISSRGLHVLGMTLNSRSHGTRAPFSFAIFRKTKIKSIFLVVLFSYLSQTFASRRGKQEMV